MEEEENKETKEETGSAESQVEEIEKSNEEEFVDLLEDKSFLKVFEENLIKFIRKNILTDKFNDFKVISYIEFMYENEPYGFSADFKSSVSINLDDDEKVIYVDVPEIDVSKIQLPSMETLENVEVPANEEKINKVVNKILNSMKN